MLQGARELYLSDCLFLQSDSTKIFIACILIIVECTDEDSVAPIVSPDG